ncbi:MAG: allantoinase AllB [Alphaproteobacteria bacterium]|nr:allantoinase AllB [Alphaproteobacteria bacterium]MCB9698054.1 allantoinase AllB [Alphaproteobacteria bacterium]
MPPELTLCARWAVLPDGLGPANVTVRDGHIAAVTPAGPVPAGAVVLEDDEVLLPALTDTHVHLNEPGRTEWEGVRTGTRAAAAGGVTLLVDMPLNSDPVTTSLAALRTKIEAVQGQLHVDLGLWGGVVPGNAAELGPMVAEGALGFKAFLCHSGIDDFPASTEADLRAAMPILRDLGVPLLVHAELEAELRGPLPDDHRSYVRYLHSRPKEWEDRAVALVARLVEETGCRAHIVHLSSAGALNTLREAKKAGLPLTAETCPHYLGLASDEVPDGATAFKCAPPIRERENQHRLWEALMDGTLDVVVTDHSPCTPELKRFDTGDFESAWGGIASLQLGLRAVWTEARRRGMPLEEVVRLMSAAPAALIGLERGAIAVGARADLVVLRPEVERAVDPAELLHRHPTTPWAGRVLAGEVRTTWMRGERIVEDGRPVGDPIGTLVRGRQWRGGAGGGTFGA